MVITQQQIRRAVPEVSNKLLDQFVASLNMWSEPFKINTPQRMAHYLTQVIFESGYLKSVEENMNYSAERLLQVFPEYFKSKEEAASYARNPMKIANRVYANRMGNGNEASGDGWRYHGRGFIMLTGKSNYYQFSKYDLCTKDVVVNPESVAEFPLNQVASMWFWERNNINAIADLDDGKAIGEDLVTRITKIVNGGTNGLAQRKYIYRKIRRDFGY